MPPIVLHYLVDSRANKVLWLLEELQVSYTIKLYPRTPDGFATPELKKIHPLGKSPVITDGDLTIAESGAIVEYLIHKYGNGKLRPTDAGYVDNLYFSNYAEGSLTAVIVQKLIFTLIPIRAPFYIRPIVRAISTGVINTLVQPALEANGKLIESALGKSQSGWFAGGDEPTSADFMMLHNIEALLKRSPDVVGDHSQTWVEKVYARPAYKAALDKLAAQERTSQRLS